MNPGLASSRNADASPAVSPRNASPAPTLPCGEPLTRSWTRGWGSRTFVMGIVNVTPDSFSGDGLLARAADTVGVAAAGRPANDAADQANVAQAAVRAAVDQASRMVAEGADIVDVGGESTRPGHAAVSEDEEASRVIPAIAAIRAALPDTPISVDTSKPAVAEAAAIARAYEARKKELADEAARQAAKMSIQGVQPKLNVHLNISSQVFDLVDFDGPGKARHMPGLNETLQVPGLTNNAKKPLQEPTYP